MLDFMHRRDDCRACGSHNLTLAFSLNPSPIGDVYVTLEQINIPQPCYPIDLYMCQNCGLVQMLDVISKEILYGENIVEKSYVTPITVGLKEHFSNYADNVSDRCKLSCNSLVVNIGDYDVISSNKVSDRIALLDQFKNRGMRVLAIEPAMHNSVRTSACGITTIKEPISSDLAKQIVAKHGVAKVVTANYVFANNDDLLSWVNALHELLASDGVFVFESIYLADLMKNLVFDFIYHEHLSTFSVKPIKALFERAGMELAFVEQLPLKGGALRYFVQRPGGPLGKDGSVNEMLAQEELMGLYRKETFSIFADKVNGLKLKTRSFLAQAKNEGKNIAGFGASITCTTLIYHFEIGEYLDYLVDDNPAKQGRFSPGLHIPVLPLSTIYERTPDYVIILAWRFAEAFIRKNPGFINNGGHIIIPAPEFLVI